MKEKSSNFSWERTFEKTSINSVLVNRREEVKGNGKISDAW